MSVNGSTAGRAVKQDKVFVDLLAEEVKGRYAMLLRNQEYPQNQRGRTVGEVDLMGINPTYIDFYEVKAKRSELGVMTAIDQLLRHRHYFQFDGDSYLFTPKNGIEDLEDVMKEFGVDEMSPQAINMLVRRMKRRK